MNEERQYLRFGGKSWHVSISKDFWFDTTLSVEARCLWVTLYFHVSQASPNPFPSQARLSSVLGWHRQTLRRYLKELEDKHYLSRYLNKFEVTIYTIYCDPKEWEPALPASLIRDNNGHVRVEIVSDRDGDAVKISPYRGENFATTVAKKVPRHVAKFSPRQEPQNTPQSPENQDTGRDPKSPKDSPLEDIPIEEGAASPPVAIFSSKREPEAVPLPGAGNQEPTPEFMALQLAKHYTKLYGWVAGRRNTIMSTPSREQAEEFFRDTIDWTQNDVAYVGVKALLESAAHPYTSGIDPYWACRRFASPNMICGMNADNQYRVLRMAQELNYTPGDLGPDQLTEEIDRMAAPYKAKNK
jgi:hypothetical protein